MRTLYLLHNLLHHQRHSPKTLGLLYLIYTIRTAVFTYLCIFLPFYYYQDFLKMQLSHRSALILTLGVFLVFQLAHIAGSLYATYLGRITSVKKTFLLSALILILTTLMLSFRRDPVTIFVSGLGFGFHTGLWWVTYHLEFALAGKKTTFGHDVGMRQAMGIAFGVVLTVISALIITEYGFMAMYLATSFLLTIMALTIFMLEDRHLQASSFSWREMFREIKKYPRDFVTYFGVGAEGFVAEIIWPLLLFFVFKSALTVGLLAALVTVIAFVTRIVAGKLTDKFRENRVENFGVATVSLVWLGKLVSPNPVSLMVFDSLYRIFSAFYYIPATTLNYVRSLTENKTVYITSREIVGLAGKTLALLVSMVLLYFGIPVWWLLLIGVLAPLFPQIFRNITAKEETVNMLCRTPEVR